jgi:hypothetical protein
MKEKINALLVTLGMKAVEIQLEQQMLSDGMTVIEAEVFEVGQPVFIVAEDQKIALPVGEYTFEDGRMLIVSEEGIIGEIKDATSEEEAPEEVAPEQDAEMKETMESPQAKKIIESIVKEMQFAKDQEIEALKAEITELKKVPEVPEVELSVDPIVYNPENKTEVKKVNIAPNKIMSTQDVVMAKLWGNK